MKRKIIKQGTSSLTLSLPAKWTKRYKLKAGDELEVDIEPEGLRVSTEKSTVSKSSELILSGLPVFMVRYRLRTCYVRGDDEVMVKFDDPSYQEVIERSVLYMPGFEIMDQGTGFMLIKDLAGTPDIEFDNVLRRIFLLILSMAKEGYELIQKGKLTELNELQKRDYHINKFVNYCLRSLNKYGHRIFKDTIHYYTILTLLELLGDEYSRMFRLEDTKISKEVMRLYADINTMVEDFHKLFYSYNDKGVMSLVDRRYELRERSDKLFMKATPSEVRMLYYLRKIAELVINLVSSKMILEK